MIMQTKFFRINDKEYCHISDEAIFIFNSKEPTRIPLEDELGNAWGISSILNYIVFVLLLFYTSSSLGKYSMSFFKYPINYGGLLLLFMSLIKIKEGFQTSSSPTIPRKKVRSVYLKSPKFSYPSVAIYFDGPEGKILRRNIRVSNKKEALLILQETGLIKK